MLLDLHALQNGLDLINHISSRTVPRGREYVGSYIKAFYYDEDELLEWAKANKVSRSLCLQLLVVLTFYLRGADVVHESPIRQSTQKRHRLDLDIKRLRELVLKIDALIS